MDTTTEGSLRELAQRYSPAQRRTLEAALELFADHGVGGTSLQMIADSLGVTKAAVYHQFNTKEAIVTAVLEVELERIEAALDDVAPIRSRTRAREVLLSTLIDAVLERRHAFTTLQHDPVIVRLLGEHGPSRQLWQRLFSELVGDDPGARTRVRAAVLSAALTAVAHPFTADLDDDTLRSELFSLTRPLLRSSTRSP